MNSHLSINGRRIGPGEPVYVIAELSANHNQCLERAVELVQAAKAVGADAVKLQTYTPDTMTIACAKDYFRIPPGSPWAGRILHDLYAEAYTPWEWLPQLQQVAERSGLDLFSTPFDRAAVEFLEPIGVPAFKIASFEMVDLALIERVARTGRPLILSTGMCTLAEIDEAVGTARGAGADEIALLKCTSAYPAAPEDMHLRTLPHLAETFGVPVGISDHSLGISAAVAAVTLGASIVEKHFTLSRSQPGPDSGFSLEPAEFRAMVDAVREAQRALGSVCYGVTEAEARSRVFRRSLFVVNDIAAGEVFTPQHVRSIRPGHGLHPRYLGEVIGRRAAVAIERGTPLAWRHLG
jgi:N-acetylneuraminate synthase